VTSDVGGAFGGRQPGRWRRLWRAAASEGGGQERLAIPRVSAAGKNQALITMLVERDCRGIGCFY
jgi:hypothetical protein